MHPKIKLRPTGKTAGPGMVKPLLLHDVTNPTASANAASRRRMLAAPVRASHARHHVSRQTQSS